MSKKPKSRNAQSITAGRVKSFVERVERLIEERDAITSDIRDVFEEAKSDGYDVKTLRWIVQERKVGSADRDERDALRDTYAHALGMAVNLVRVEGLSLREAAAATGASKSSIQRALSVPAVSQDVSHDADGVIAEPNSDAAPSHTHGTPQTGAGWQAVPVEPVPEAGIGTGTIPDDMPPIPDFLRRTVTA